MNDVVEALRRMKQNFGMRERTGGRGRPSGQADTLDARSPSFRAWLEASEADALPDITDETVRIRRLAWNSASFPDLPKLNERLAENGMSIRAALHFPAGLLDEVGISGERIVISSEVPHETIGILLRNAGHWPAPEEAAARSRGMPTEDVVPDMAQALQRAGGDFRFLIDGPAGLSRVTRHFETVRKAAHFGGTPPLVDTPSAELLHDLQTAGTRKTKRLSDAEIATAFGQDPDSITGGSDTQAASIRRLSLMLERVGMDIRIAMPDPAYGWVVADRLNRSSTFARLAGSLDEKQAKSVRKALADPGKFGLKEIRKAFTAAGSEVRFVLCGPEKGHEEVFDGGAIVSERTLRIISRRDWERRKAAGEEMGEDREGPGDEDQTREDGTSADVQTPERDEGPEP
ncbi:hypothetical protein [Paracoccus sp. ME4]|uniref:hypothetical protein n=1 Tax=Paracoccus sp. ME4 TaxID=3138066 RepID=UPI00398AE135